MLSLLSNLFKNNSNSQNTYGLKPFEVKKVQIKGTRIPKPRSGHRIVSNESEVYSFGGFNPMIAENDPEMVEDQDWNRTKPLFQELWKFSLLTKTWTRLRTTGNPPEHLASHSAALFRNNLLVFGGTGIPFGHRSSNDIYVCNLKTLNWICIKSLNQRAVDSNAVDSDQRKNEIPVEQYGQAMVIDDTEDPVMYVCGGTDGFTYSIDIHCFNFKTQEWSQLYRKNRTYYEDFPEERYRHEMIFYNKKLYVFGGGSSQICFSLTEIPVFDIKTHEWDNVVTTCDSSEYPLNRKCHACVRIDDHVFVIGGTNGLQVFNDLWKLDLKLMKWSRIKSKIGRTLNFHSASVSASGQTSIFGGVTNVQHTERTNDLYIIWLKIPSLAEIAFNAIIHYIEKSNNTLSMSESLDKLELPLEYRYRLKSSVV